MKSRRTRWILGILAVVLVAVGFVRFASNDRKHIEYAEKLGCIVGRKQLLPSWVYQLLPQQVHPLIPEGSVDKILFPVKSQATDKEIKLILEYFPDLIWLNLSGSRITDEALKSVLTHSKLQSILLDDTSVTDGGVIILSKSRRLIEVSLNRTRISDASISHFSKMSQLERLSIAETSLSDKSVDMLCKMSKLFYLNVSGCQLSQEEKRRLKENISTVLK